MHQPLSLPITAAAWRTEQKPLFYELNRQGAFASTRPPDSAQPQSALGHFKKKSIQTMAAAIKSPTGVDHHCFESHWW